MERSERQLRLFGEVSDRPGVEWAWVDEQLRAAGTYWLVAPGGRHPHPRPVWGVWLDEQLHLSVGSPTLQRLLDPGTGVAAHLDSGTDVVIVDGVVVGSSSRIAATAAYDVKYEWSYDVAVYGPLTLIQPRTVLAWRAGGWAGRDSFQQTSRWDLTTPEPSQGQP
jgi:hypothetical protein